MGSGAPRALAVSVVIPVYNRASALGATLQSVQKQTFTEFEVLVVDDGSDDDPAGVAASLSDPRFRVIHQANSGAGAARNLGIDAARGRYVAFLDSDDMFLPHHLCDAMAALKTGRYAAVYSQVIMDRGDETWIIKPPRGLGENENVASYLMCDGGFIPSSTLVVEAGLARRIRYHERIRFGQDTDFALRLSLAGAAIHMLGSPGARKVSRKLEPYVCARARTPWLSSARLPARIASPNRPPAKPWSAPR